MLVVHLQKLHFFSQVLGLERDMRDEIALTNKLLSPPPPVSCLLNIQRTTPSVP